jgi:PAS domain S-box-containing protein
VKTRLAGVRVSSHSRPRQGGSLEPSGDVTDAAVGLVTVDDQGMVVELDANAEKALGVRGEDARGRALAELIIPRGPESAHWIAAPGPAPTGRSPRFRRGARVKLEIGRISAEQARSLGGSYDALALDALLERAEELAKIGSWHWNLDDERLVWSDNLYRIFGLDPGEIVPSARYVVDHVHPGDRERVERSVQSVRKDGLVPPVAFRIMRPDGSVRHLRATQALVEQSKGGPRRVVGSVQDETDRHRVESTIAAHLAVAESLAEWRTLEQGATGLLRSLVVALDCALGVLWVPEGDVLVAQVIWRGGTLDLTGLESVIRQLRLPRGVGLAGEVWAEGESRTAPNLAEDPRFPPEAVAGLGGASALPATYLSEVLAVIELHMYEPLSADADRRLRRSLTSIGHELGEFLAHRRGELRPSALTPRELEVLQLAAQGFGGREIAEKLVLSHATVRTHFEHIYEKYGVSDRASAVAQALRDGAID